MKFLPGEEFLPGWEPLGNSKENLIPDPVGSSRNQDPNKSKIQLIHTSGPPSHTASHMLPSVNCHYDVILFVLIVCLF